MTELHGYTITDVDGRKVAVNQATGEVTDTFTATFPVGTVAYTPAQQEARQQRQEAVNAAKLKEAANANRKRVNAPLGAFYFADRRQRFDDLTPATLARLIYLNSYLEFNSDILMIEKSKAMNKRDIPTLLGITQQAAGKFLDEVTPKYLTVLSDGRIRSNKDLFQRGRKRSAQAMKFYKKGVRLIYEQAEKSNVKHLGYVLSLLAFINTEYNVLSLNPDEKELDKIEPIAFKDFCQMIGYDVSQSARLKKIYRDLRFEVDGERLRFVSFCDDDRAIVINPRVLYSGSDYTKVDAYALFFRQ